MYEIHLQFTLIYKIVNPIQLNGYNATILFDKNEFS